MIGHASLIRAVGLAVFTTIISGAALAQEPARDLPQHGGAGLRAGNITSTGETVPNPGASQSAGTTPMDKGIEQKDNQIESSICKGC